jgi:hypothetical protein
MKNSNKLKKRKLLLSKIAAIPNPTADLATMDKILNNMRELQAGRQVVSVHAAAARTVEVVSPAISKGLLAIANTYFRLKKKMLDPTTGEPQEPMARVYKDIDRICRHLEDMGFKIQDHTGDAYDDGQPMKVITSNPRPDATRKYVLETLTPTIYWNERIVQHGEIEIAIPAPQKTN